MTEDGEGYENQIAERVNGILNRVQSKQDIQIS